MADFARQARRLRYTRTSLEAGEQRGTAGEEVMNSCVLAAAKRRHRLAPPVRVGCVGTRIPRSREAAASMPPLAGLTMPPGRPTPQPYGWGYDDSGPAALLVSNSRFPVSRLLNSLEGTPRVPARPPFTKRGCVASPAWTTLRVRGTTERSYLSLVARTTVRRLDPRRFRYHLLSSASS